MGARVNFYAGSGLDRVSHLRADEAWIAAQLGDPRSRVVALWRDASRRRKRLPLRSPPPAKSK